MTDVSLEYMPTCNNVDNSTLCNILKGSEFKNDYFDIDTFNEKYGVTTYKCQSLAHFNCRSLAKNFENFELLVNSLKHKFKIIGLTETWLCDTSPVNMFNLENYEFLYNNRQNKRGGGTAMYIDRTLKFKQKKELTLSTESIESLFIELDSKHNNSRKTVIGVIYRPPGYSIDIFLNEFTSILNKINASSHNCFIMGDFNLDLMKIGSNTQIDNFFDLLYSYSFYSIIESPTRITSSSASLIDNIFTNYGKHMSSGILISDISDHLPIFTILTSSYMQDDHDAQNSFKKRYINESNLQLFSSKLYESDWNIYDYNDVNKTYGNFMRIFMKLYDECFPIKSVYKRTCKRKQWITRDLLKLCHKRSKLYKEYLKNPSKAREKRYKEFRNFVTAKLRHAKREFYYNKFNDVKNNSKCTWNLINMLLKKNDKKKLNFDAIRVENDTFTNAVDITNAFNNFFVNIGEKLLEQQESANHESFHLYLKSPNTHTAFFKPITVSEILNIVNDMKNETSAGIDSVNIKVVKCVISLISNPLCIVFNQSLSSGIVPDDMKVARITPIHKKGKIDDVNNYRPVSVLNIFSKILERCIYKRLLNFVNKHDILFKNQFGFRKGHSTSTAILELIHNINQAIDTGEFTLAVFIDLSKAFDVIDHSILLRKLDYYGIRGLPLKWFCSYLESRKHLTVINNIKSECKTVRCGVPQGSILGPLLFLIYINDITFCTQSINFILFADDTSIFTSGKDLLSLYQLVNKQLDNISIWMQANRLILNTEKTNYMIFGTRQTNNVNLKLQYRNREIMQVQYIKFLGVYLDDKLSWNYHINDLCNKLAKSIGILYKLQFLPQKILKLLYYSLVSSHLSYCNIIWGLTSKSNLNRIHKLQKRVIRIITHSNFLCHSNPLFKQMQILPIHDMISLNIATFMYTVYENVSLPKSFEDYFTQNCRIHNYDTRSSNDFHLPLHRTSTTKDTLFFYGPLLWNNLPDSVKKCKSLQHFKRLYKSHLISLICHVNM